MSRWAFTRDTAIDPKSRSPQVFIDGYLRACVCRRAKMIDGMKVHGWERTDYFWPLGPATVTWHRTEDEAKRE